MKELDVILSRYLEQEYPDASAVEQERFRRLLEIPDPDLYSLLLGRSTVDDPELAEFIGELRGGPKPGKPGE